MATIYTTKPLPARAEHDVYPTPAWLAQAGVATLSEAWAPRILDLGAGSGVWGDAARLRWPDAEIVGVDVRPLPHPTAYDEWWTGSFPDEVSRERLGTFDIILGNPPYKEAEPFIDAGLPMLSNGGAMLLLLRLAFLEGQKRRDGLFTRHPPRVVTVCSKRPSFTGDNKTNATAFALFHWTAHVPKFGTELRWLGQNGWTTD